MDKEDQKPLRGIPQTSRIPLPRATLCTKVAELSHDDNSSRRLSHIPRPLGTSSLRLRGKKLFTEDADHTSKSQYGWNVHQSRDRSPTRSALQPAQVTSLDATPPKSDDIIVVEGDENPILAGQEAQKQKRKPRPSLSERTLETLSQIPPSPSPSRIRSTFVNGGNLATTPINLNRTLRLSQSNANLRGRSTSPVKPSPRPASRIGLFSRTNVQPHSVQDRQQALIAPNSVEVPKATVPPSDPYQARASLTSGKGRQQLQSQVPSKLHVNEQTPAPLNQREFEPNALKPTSTAKASQKLRPIAPKLAKTTKPYAQSDVGRNGSTPKSVDNRINSNSSSTTPRPTLSKAQLGKSGGQAISDSEKPWPQAKSSLTLRETIARAKAAKKEVTKQPVHPVSIHDSIEVIDMDQISDVDNNAAGIGEKGMQRRIRGAVTSGVLNIAAMGLRSLPEEIKGMYDFDPDSKISWSEAVDLTKFVAADNELLELSDVFFPDWSMEELEADENKTNEFGGLQILDLRGNLLSQMPIGLRRLQQLRTLNLSSNKLSLDILEPICQITSLRELVLANNQMEGTIPHTLAELSELRVLDLHGNQLSALPHDVSELRNLQILDISDNKFTTVPLLNLQQLPLRELIISENSLSGVFAEDSLAFADLEVLNVASNRLECLSNGQFDLPKLQSLICDRNRLTMLPNFSLLKSLTALTASGNKIATIPESFASANSLHNVDLSANEIKDLDPSIARMDNLITMNIAANPLRERKFLTMSTDNLKTELSKRIEGMQTDVDTSSSNTEYQLTNGFQSEVDHAKHIYKPQNGTLDLSSQHLSCVDTSTIDLSRPVHTIRLSNNSLTHVPFDLLNHPNVQTFLNTLDMSHNPLLDPTTYLDNSIELPALKSLYIVSTGLTSLEALTTHLIAPNLQELNLSCHRLSGPVPSLRAYFPSLVTLLATDNWFTSIDVEHVRGFEVIDIRNNHLDNLPPKIGELGNLESSKPAPGRLRAFECSGNLFRVPRLTVIEKGTEAVLKDLRRMVPFEEVGEEWQ